MSKNSSYVQRCKAQNLKTPTISTRVPFRFDFRFPEVLNSESDLSSCFGVIVEVVIVGIPLRYTCNTNLSFEGHI